MEENNFIPNYEHFTDIVALSVGRVLENNIKKGKSYSYETFCLILKQQIENHFGINPEEFFDYGNDDSQNVDDVNYKGFSEEVVKVITNLENEEHKVPTKEECILAFKDIQGKMVDYRVEPIDADEYLDKWSNEVSSSHSR